jgi:hypothetical protein
MTVTPEEQLIQDNIKLLQSMQFEGMTTDARQNMIESINDINEDYATARAIADNKDLTDAQRKYGTDLGNAIAKSLPGVVSGALRAEEAFAKGDNRTGAAAVMDICASLIPVLASIAGATGPEGAIVGALFSAVGQILAFFAPKPPSLESKIKKMLDGLAAEKVLEEMEAVETSIDAYTKSLRSAGKDLRPLLKLPVATQVDLDTFQERISALNLGLADGQRALEAPVFASWKVGAWLLLPEHHEIEKWPEVLGHWLQAYSNLTTANIMLKCLVNHKELVKGKLYETREELDAKDDPGHPLGRSRSQAHQKVIHLEALADANMKHQAIWSLEAQKILEALRANAKARGLFVILGEDQYVYAATGRSQLAEAGWKSLPMGYGGRGRRISITVPKGQVNSLTPLYNYFFCEQWIQTPTAGDVQHGMIKQVSMESFDGAMIWDKKPTDVWALPKESGTSYLYGTEDNGATGNLHMLEVDEAGNKVKEGGWNHEIKADPVGVRAVTHPAATLVDDPDGHEMPPNLLGGRDHVDSIVYAAFRSSSDIWVSQSGTTHYVPAPWGTYTGIDIDPYYLWVFRAQGFACATHASVLSCIQGKRAVPRWMEHSPNGLLGDQNNHDGNFWLVDGQETKPAPPLLGLTAFSPCSDRTLFANIYTRSSTWNRHDFGYHPVWVADDRPATYTADYGIDVKAGRIDVGSWSKCGAIGAQVQKMPIPCWSLFESLTLDLQER